MQDAVTVDGAAVIFSAPFKDFTTSPTPQTIEEYREYRQRVITFIEARNRRILRYCSEDHSSGLNSDTPSVSSEMSKTSQVATPLPVRAVLDLARKYGTRGELERALRLAARKGLRVRPFKTCLMFTPPSNATRCMFTLWAKRDGGQLRAYVAIEGFTLFFPLQRTAVEKKLGPDGWRRFDEAGFEAFLQHVEALDLGS